MMIGDMKDFSLRLGLFTALAGAGCSHYNPDSGRWRQEGQHIAMLPLGLETGENLDNVIAHIEGRKRTNRFVGIDFFPECYQTLSPHSRQWYAIFYCAGHKLEGEYISTVRMAIREDRAQILLKMTGLTPADWRAIGTVLVTDPALARKRAYGVIGYRRTKTNQVKS